MKKIEAIIQPYKLNEVTDALNMINIKGLTVSEVRGFGHQKGYTEIYRGKKFKTQFNTKVKLEIVVTDENVQEVTRTIIENSRTGNVGDGKIFISPIEETIQVRTGERGKEVL